MPAFQLRKRQRRDWKDIFAGHMQRFTAGHQHFEFWAIPQQLRHGRGGDGDLLKIIKEKQYFPLADLTLEIFEQRLIAFFPQANGACKRCQSGGRVAAGCQVGPINAVFKVGQQILCGLQRQACLACATWTKQGQKA